MLRAYLYLMIFIPVTFMLALSAILFTLIDSTGRVYHLHAKLWGWIGLRLAGARLEVTGREKIPADGPVIYMSNHQGNFDILALFLAIPRQFSWIAKEELFAIPVFGHSMRRAGYIPLDRSDGRRAFKSIEAAAAMIRSGRSVVIFPEGTRTPDGNLLPFKRGGFLLAAKAGVPIVPFTINGSARVNPCKRLELYPGKITIRFAEPIHPVGGGGAQRDQLMEQVRTAIAAGLEP
ncbi:MAG TPA: lysophospholipid acyltransferase family protein [Geobacteraceae bacterium]|nr:lysophospholipid acyltransferase family protein [Geobacteraceae bacterium]